MTISNISPDWTGSTRAERRIIQGVLVREATPQAVTYFARHCERLGDYWYWYTLGTLWVSYTGWSDLALWRRLFSSRRPGRETSLMKPDELMAFRKLPDPVPAWRAHRPGETDWLSYTLSSSVAARMAVARGVDAITAYALPRRAVLALFLRRGEAELLSLHPRDAMKHGRVAVTTRQPERAT